jgi:hypothetical protein
MSPSRRRRRRASPEWEGREVIRVATLPGRGLYARHLGHPEGVDGVHRVNVAPAGATGRPASAFTPQWIRANVDAVDVVHVLGVPSRLGADEVAQAADLVRDAGKPLVMTAYHLSDPAGSTGRLHAEQLDALVPRCDQVITLTASAAEEVRRRWSVEPVVLPHPHVVDFVRMRRERPRFRGKDFLVGCHLAGLRGPVDAVGLARSLASAVQGLKDTRLVVYVNDHVLDPGSSSYDPQTVRRIDDAVSQVGGIVRAQRPLSESQLWDHLFALDVSVVPGLHGSHSVWPEACHDLGTSAVLPAGSHAAGQRPCLVYDTDRRGGGRSAGASVDPESLGTALKTAREQGSVWRADPAERWKERVGIAEALRGVYERLSGYEAGRSTTRSSARSSAGLECVSAPTLR